MPTTTISYYDRNWFAVNFNLDKYKLSVALKPPWIEVGLEKEITSQELAEAMIQCANDHLAGNSLEGRFIDAEGDRPQVFVTDADVEYSLPVPIDDLKGLAEEPRVVWSDSKPDPAGGVLKVVLVVHLPATKNKRDYVDLDAVPELGKILFPSSDPDEEGRFPLPKDGAVTPRLVVIQGAAGTGKSTFAVQLMIGFAKRGVRCDYRCTNDPPSAIVHTATDYEFVTPGDLRRMMKGPSPLVQIKDISDDLEGQIQHAAEDTPHKPPAMFDRIWAFVTRREREKPIHAEAIFIDSLDPYLGTDRPAEVEQFELRELLRKLKAQPRLSFLIIEDSPGLTDPVALRHLADCEYLADIFIELKSDARDGYQLNAMRVKKRHFGTHVRGWHEYKLLPRQHSLSNIDRSHGFSLYPSLHFYLSGSRNDTWARKVDFTHTGLAHLDSILCSDRHLGPLDGRSLPRNACIVIQATDSPYDIALGTNILLGGLWQPEDLRGHGPRPAVREGGDVLVVSLNEETNLDLGREALAYRTALFTARTPSIELDTGCWIRWRRHDAILGEDAFKELLRRFGDVLTATDLSGALLHAKILERSKGYVGPVFAVRPNADLDWRRLRRLGLYKPKENRDDFYRALQALLLSTRDGEEHWGGVNRPAEDDLGSTERPNCPLYRQLFSKASNVGKKVVFNKWCVRLLHSDGSGLSRCAKVVIATFRAGCITPEEFLKTLQLILKEGRFTRVLFSSTALLGQRFPLLERSDLFVEAIIALFKSHNIVSVFLDPQVKTNKDPLSLCLSSLADYLIELKPHGGRKPEILCPKNAKGELGAPRWLKRLQANSYENPWSEMKVRNIRGKNYTDALHLVTVRPLAAAPAPKDMPGLVRSLEMASADGRMDELRKRLFVWGFLRGQNGGENDDVTTDLAYISQKAFAEIFEQELKRMGFDTARVWKALNDHRPSSGNELHCVNHVGSEEQIPDDLSLTPEPVRESAVEIQ